MDINSTQLRYHTADLFAALARNETVNLYKRGQLVAEIMPVGRKKKSAANLADHPFFGSLKDNGQSSADIVRKLRKPRFPRL